ncbi:MAG: DUF2892 domain-containing protein [Chloroflexi bacterium]|nr:DUF2892 domain-containing protein [Chloroflexota bacterium]
MGNNLVEFIISPTGRITQIVAGMLIVAVGLISFGTFWGVILAGIGLVPIFAASYDFCLLGPLFGLPISAKAIRGDTSHEH